MSTDERQQPHDGSEQPDQSGQSAQHDQADPASQQPPASSSGRSPARPIRQHDEHEAETFIGYAKPSAGPSAGPGSIPNRKPAVDPDATLGPARKPNTPSQSASAQSSPPPAPGKPGAWSGAKSNILGHNQPGARSPSFPRPPVPAPKAGTVSDSWDQSINDDQATMPPGHSPSGFGTMRTLDRGRIGPYPLERELGRGGMGVVYLARDEKLGRAVAIKVLPDMFAQHPERAARFEREARLLASLNHANIASIYELGEEDGARYLTLEYVPGLTLSEKLHSGSIPIDESLHICAQIAEGLEAAHEKGVIHRDLKPGNVKITPEGIVKVLDFGLAKSSGPDGSSPEASPDMPTGGIGNTQEGMILGTAGYMSPEQARGRPLDKRTDVWSFGCVLYETLTGRSPFYADTVSDTIALILRTDPDWSVLPAETPERVRELLRRCFIKDPKRRLRDLGEARIELQAAHEAFSSFEGLAASSVGGTMAMPTAAVPARRAGAPAPDAAWWQYVPWAMAGLAVAVAAMVTAALVLRPDGFGGGGGSSTRNADASGIIRFSSAMPTGVAALPRGLATVVAVSDNERWTVVSAERDSRRRLYARSLDGTEFLPVGDIMGATTPFFAPDASQLGFVRPGVIERISTDSFTTNSNAQPTVIVDGIAGDIAGATWTDSNQIVYAVATGSRKGLYQAPADQRGRGTPLTMPNSTGSDGSVDALWPHAVRGTELVVYTARSGSSWSLRWLSLSDTSKNGEILTGGRGGFVVGRGSTRFLVYAVGGSLEATRIQVSASGITNLGGVQSLQSGLAVVDDTTHFALSDSGLLAFLPLAERDRQLQSVAIVGDATAAPELANADRVGGMIRVDPANPQRMAYITNDRTTPVRVVAAGQDTIDATGILGEVTSIAWRSREPNSGLSTLTMTVRGPDRTTVMDWNPATGVLAELPGTDRLVQPLVHAWDPKGQLLYLSQDTVEGTRELQVYTAELRSANRIFDDTASLIDVATGPTASMIAYTRVNEGTPRVQVRFDPTSEQSQVFEVPGAPSWAPLWIRSSVEGASSTGGTLLVQRADGIHAYEMTGDLAAPIGTSPRRVHTFPGTPGSEREYDAASDGSWVLVPMIERGQGGEVNLVVNFNHEVEQKLSRTP